MEQFYNMSWKEFVLKSFAYHRIQKDEWRKFRLVAYYARFAPYIKTDFIDSIEKFYPLGDKQRGSSISDLAKANFIESSRKYYENKRAKEQQP